MEVKVEKLEGNYARLTIECPPEKFEEAVENVYRREKSRIQLDGFRKGKAPRKMIEKIYGEGVFYEDAANDLIERSYSEALLGEEAKDLEIMAPPVIEEVKEIGKDKPFIYTAKVALKPEVELGEYKNLGVEKKTAEVTDADVEAEIEKTREQNARIEYEDERPIKEGDIAVIDYEGSIDGVPFEGGKAEGHELTIGSHSFIDTFEEQLIGHKADEEVEVNVTFPEEYHAKELAGKPALFRVKINAVKVKELPELNDEFAGEVSEFETLEAYRADVKQKLLEKKEAELQNERREEILKKAVENAKMDLPDEIVTYQARNLMRDYADRLERQGLSFEMFLKYTGQTEQAMIESYKETAKTRYQNYLVLSAIAEKEAIEVTDEEVEKEIEDQAKAYGMEADKLKELLSDAEKENMKKEIAADKALKLISE